MRASDRVGELRQILVGPGFAREGRPSLRITRVHQNGKGRAWSAWTKVATVKAA